MQPEAFFLPASPPEGGERFCLFYPAQSPHVKGWVLYIHPFAEELNKSRRMAALQARALADAGWSVLQLDLLGCGDSSGDFGDATWNGWLADVRLGCEWLRQRQKSASGATTSQPLWLWGLRCGSLLVTQCALQLDHDSHVLLWQPPSSGKTLLQQFLRLQLTSELLSGKAKDTQPSLRAQLDSGSPVDVAGYTLAPALARGLAQSTLDPGATTGHIQSLTWLEVSPRPEAQLSPAALKTLARWRQTRVPVTSHIVGGPAFWQSTEIEEAPALITQTLAALASPP